MARLVVCSRHNVFEHFRLFVLFQILCHEDFASPPRVQRGVDRENIFRHSHVKVPQVQARPHRILCPGGCALALFRHCLTRACRWVRDPVWGSAKAQDFEAVLVMAAEARKKCAEANAQRAPAGDKAPKKRRVKAARVAEESTVRVFDLESAMASAPVQRVASIDD